MIHRSISLVLLISFYLTAHGDVYLVFGGQRGWIGQKLVQVLNEKGHTVHCATSRIEQRESIEQEILKYKPNYIINAAGVIGKPNVDWCESHKEETLRGNVLGALNVVDVAFLHNIHVTNITTGCIYQYDEAHALGSGKGFTEEEDPNFSGSFYSRTKIMAEKLVLMYPNVLNLRVRMPIAADLDPKSFVGKIIQYKKLINIPNSMTILEDLLPLVPQMIERGLVGNYNFVNPGTLSHNQVIELYKEYINPDHQYENFSIEEQNKILAVPRSNCELSAEKLLKEFPQIPHIQDSLRKILASRSKGV